jgi:hypothetical protein
MCGEKEIIRAFLIRVQNILIRPHDEWQVIRDESKTYSTVIFHYIAVLALIPPAAAVIDGIVSGRIASKTSSLFFFSSLFLRNMLWYGICIIDVVMTGAIITAVVKTSGSRWSGVEGLKIAAFSFTPLFTSGVLAFIPGMNWIIYAAIPYSVYLLFFGIMDLASTGRKKAMRYAIAVFLAASVILSVMNLLEYFFENTLLNSIVS